MKKRAHGDGYVKRLPNGTWFGQIMDGYKENGKKNIVSFTAPTKSEVQHKMRCYLGDQSNPDAKPKMPTFCEWADVWYASYRTEVKASTYSNYRHTLAHLQAYFCDTPIDEINTIHINALLDQLHEEGASRSKISKCRTMMIQILDYAEANNLLVKNPARRAKTMRSFKSSKSTKKDAFTQDEQGCLMRELPDDMIGNSIRALLGSGMRVQELLALRQEDIDTDGATIRITKAVEMVDGKPVLGSPKSEHSNRVIPIPEYYRSAVRYIREHGSKIYLWISRRENFLCSIDYFRNKYYAELDKLPTVRRLSPHCCRHTYVTDLQRKGVPMETIAALVGHSDIETTDDYLHISQQTLREAVVVLNQEVE